MGGVNYAIKHGHGKYNILDKAYNKFIIDSINKGRNTDIETERWEIYNRLMIDLINLGKMDYFEEAKYRLTGGENPNEVMLDMVRKDYDTRLSLTDYEEQIKYFIDWDIISRFYRK